MLPMRTSICSRTTFGKVYTRRGAGAFTIHNNNNVVSGACNFDRFDNVQNTRDRGNLCTSFEKVLRTRDGRDLAGSRDG